MDTYTMADFDTELLASIRKDILAMPAQKNTRPFAAKEIISHTASKSPDLNADPVIPQRNVAFPKSPKVTTAITPDPFAGAFVT